MDVRDHKLSNIDNTELKILFGGINTMHDTIMQFYDDGLLMLKEDIFMRDIFKVLYKYFDNGLFKINTEYNCVDEERNDLIVKYQLKDVSSCFKVPTQVRLI